jgi:hypothetical protein
VIGLPRLQALELAQGAQIWALIQGLSRFSHKNARTFDNWFDESFPLLGLSGARGRRRRSGLGEAGNEFIGLVCKKFMYRFHRQK